MAELDRDSDALIVASLCVAAAVTAGVLPAQEPPYVHNVDDKREGFAVNTQWGTFLVTAQRIYPGRGKA